MQKQDQWLLAGKIRSEILRLAKKTNAQFILASSQYIQELQQSPDFQKTKDFTLLNIMGPLTNLHRA